jgi:pimeloyl-ACP methyl ester carboxylesterase
MNRFVFPLLLATASLAHTSAVAAAPTAPVATTSKASATIHYRHATIDGVKIFYREAGPADGPVVLLLHGFPTSSHMFRNLIPLLADRYRVIAPDYPGFGQSDAPDHNKFSYSFGNYANMVDTLMGQIGARRYAMYVMDYGAPVGYRLALKHPERVTGLIIQNGNAYDEGLREFWDPIKTYWTDGTPKSREALSGLVTISRGSARITGCMIRRCWIVRETRMSSLTCSTTIAPTCRFIRSSRLSFVNASHQL